MIPITTIKNILSKEPEYWKSPQFYALQYRNLTCHTIENGLQSINASKYLSTNSKSPGKYNKQNVKDKFQNFLKTGKNEETGILYRQGDYIVDSRIQGGRVLLGHGEITGPFNGKGTPDRYMRLLKAVDFYLTVGCKRSYVPHGWKSSNIPTLQKFADDYMGVDCNCLVGGYFKTFFPKTGWDVGVYWGKNGLYKGPKRKSLLELLPLDVLVRYYKRSDKHVAVVAKVNRQDEKTADVEIVQSAGSKGGVWIGNCQLRINRDGSIQPSGGYRKTFNKGAYGVIGANCE